MITRFYGVDCGLRDPFGNAIRITELAPAPQQAPAPASPAPQQAPATTTER